MRMSNCHLDVKHFAKGLCRPCYYQQWYQSTKEVRLKKSHDHYLKNKARYNEACKQWMHKHPERMLWSAAKHRAHKKGLVFSLLVEDIKIPPMCPVLGIPIIPFSGRASPNSPSIDRINNSEGYTKENSIVVSFRANSIKRDADVEELKKIADFYVALQ